MLPNTASSRTINMKSNLKTAFQTVVSLFFLWGFITVLNDVLISYFKERYVLSDFESMFVQFFFFGAYGIGATTYYLIGTFSQDPINRIGYKKGMVIGAVITGLSCAMFYPTMMVDSYYVNIIPLIFLGLGLTLLQIACNPYVILLGDVDSADSRLNLAQGLNSVGTALSPVIGGFFIFVYFEGTTAIQVPFLFCGGLFLAVAFILWRTQLPEFSSEESASGSVWSYNQLKFGMIAIFLYVGAEVAIGSKLIDYAQTSDGGAFNRFTASQLLGFYWGGAMIGRLLSPILKSQKSILIRTINTLLLIGFGYFLLNSSISLLTYFKGEVNMGFAELFGINLYNSIPFILAAVAMSFLASLTYKKVNLSLGSFALANIVLLGFSFLAGGKIGLWLIIATGLFNSIMWSNIFVLATSGLGKLKSKGSSLLIIMIVGGAFFPLLLGLVSDLFNPRIAYLVPIISYLYIFFYSKLSKLAHE